jgi:hypothetical protein
MKKRQLIQLVITLAVLVTLSSVTIAAPKNSTDSGWQIAYDNLQSQINNLQSQITNLQELIEAIELTPGPAGPQGEIGPQGPQGEPGADGKEMKIGTSALLYDGPISSSGTSIPVQSTDGFAVVNNVGGNHVTCIVDNNQLAFEPYGSVTIPMAKNQQLILIGEEGTLGRVVVTWIPLEFVIPS